MDTATKKTRIHAAKTASKRVVQKICKSYRDLIGNKITSLGKTKSKEKEKVEQEIYIPSEKKHQIVDDLRLL